MECKPTESRRYAACKRLLEQYGYEQVDRHVDVVGEDDVWTTTTFEKDIDDMYGVSSVVTCITSRDKNVISGSLCRRGVELGSFSLGGADYPSPTIFRKEIRSFERLMY